MCAIIQLHIFTPFQNIGGTENKTMDDGLFITKVILMLFGIRGFNPVESESKRFKSWVARMDATTCKICAGHNGKIYYKFMDPEIEFPPHPNCRCKLKTLVAIRACTATIEGKDGADYWIKRRKKLPENYLTKGEAEALGWVRQSGNLQDVIPGGIIGGDIYENKKGKIPQSPGRIWFEADINYTGGRRNEHRLLYSNDGLVFVTYDHYETFYEIK